MSRLINRRRVKAFTLLMARKRAHPFTRVGGEFLLRCDAHLREFIRQHVQRHPSRGKTIN